MARKLGGGKQGIAPEGCMAVLSPAAGRRVSYSAAANSCLDPSQSPKIGAAACSRLGGVAGEGALHRGTPALNVLVCRSTSKPGNEVPLRARPGSACGVRLGLGLGSAWG